LTSSKSSFTSRENPSWLYHYYRLPPSVYMVQFASAA
jgi:aromatic ring-opening dioxygenase catalytic subunit (LigB family)